MKTSQNRLFLLLLISALTLFAGACSTTKSAEADSEQEAQAQVDTEEAEVSETEEAQAPAGDEIYLRDLLQEPEFAQAFDAMEGGDELPDWVDEGGTATPVETLEVGGNLYLAAQACKPHNCPSERIFLLYERSGNTTEGVFVNDPATDHADAGISDQAEFTWLGNPDDLTKEWLKEQLTTPQ